MISRRIRTGINADVRRWTRSFAWAVVLSVSGPIAQADPALVPCAPGTGFDYGPNPHIVCGGAKGQGAGNGVVFNAGPTPFASFLSVGGGTMGVAGAGVGGVSMSASGSGTFGEIHLTAFANNGSFTTLGDPLGSAFGMAEIVFVDGGTVDGPLGAPETLRFTVSMSGAFTGTGEGDFDFNVFDGITFMGERRAFLSSFGPSVTQTLDLNVRGGDTLFFSMDMLVQATSTNNGALVISSSADASHTGHVFLDALTPGAGFVSNSGTNYSSAAAATVPEPASWTLVIGVCAFLALNQFRRRTPCK
jgi:hypothetical protein